MPQFDSREFEADLTLAQVPVLGYLVRLTGNLADARDLLQLTNLTAWEKRTEFDRENDLVSWMCGIARNHFRNESRKWQRRATVPLLDDELEALVESRHHEREREDARRRKLLRICIDKLPERQRFAVEHFYLEGLSLEEVARKTERKANAIAQLLHRARLNLIECVRRESHHESEPETLI